MPIMPIFSSLAPPLAVTAGSCADSFRLEVCGLDDGPPLLDLGLLEGGERLRRLLLARRYVQAHVGDTLADAGIGERVDGRRVELGNGVLGRALGQPERV